MDGGKRPIDQNIAARLRMIREHRGMSGRQLAKAARVSSSLISKMETGQQRISAEYIRLFSKILRCRPGTLYKPPDSSLSRSPQPAAIGIYTWKPGSKAVHLDARAKALMGLSADAPVDFDTWHDGVHPEDLPRVDAALARSLDPNHCIFSENYRFIGYDGIERHIFDFGRVKFDSGQPVQGYGFMLDITNRIAPSDAELVMIADKHLPRCRSKRSAAIIARI
jgi:transcriptional regulator with XRE-family HTH domain